jgi:hypothetical protein
VRSIRIVELFRGEKHNGDNRRKRRDRDNKDPGAFYDHFTLRSLFAPDRWLRAEVHTCVNASATCGRPVGCNRAFEVPKFVAGNETNTFQRRELILGFAELIECQVEFA